MEMETLRHFGRDKVKLIRYADDFVVFGKELKNVLKAKEIIKNFLEPIGLKFSDEKTRIGHTMEAKEGTEGQIGLEFLGFYFRNYPTSKHRGVKQLFRQATVPSKKAISNHKRNLSEILKKHKVAPIGSVIKALASCIQS